MHFNEGLSLLKNYAKVNFAGLRGDTRSMQAEGWELSVDTQRDYQRAGYLYRLAGRHPSLNLRLLSGVALVDGRQTYMGNPIGNLEFPIAFAAPNIMINLMDKPNFSSLNAESIEHFRVGYNERFDLDDLAMFRSYGGEQEIIVPSKKILEVQDYLSEILEQQQEKQREIREMMLRDSQGSEISFKSKMQEAPKLRLVGI